MNPAYPSHDAQEQAEARAPYLHVWVALLILTVAEYIWARTLAGSSGLLIAGLLTMAAVKAGLVGLYFMHVKFEGKWVYGLIVPAAFMAAVVILGLVPDIAFHTPTWDSTPPAAAGPASDPSGNPRTDG
jgi:cytochrome c oxidase subunit 4